MLNDKIKKSQQPSFKVIYLRLLKYALKYKLILSFSIVSLFILALTNTGFLALIKKITDEGLVEKSADASILLPIAIVLLMSLRGLAGFISSYSMRWVSRKIVEDLRFDSFKRIMALPVKFFDNNAAGNIVSKLTYETEQLSTIVTKVALDAIRDILTVIGIVGYMLYLDWFLTLIFAVMAPIMGLYLKKVSPRLRQAGSEVQESMGDMTRISEEAIASQRIVKIFGTAFFELKRFTNITIRNRKMHTKLAKMSGINSLVIEVMSAIALASVVFYSISHFTAGEFAAFVGALLMLISPIKKITAINEQIQVGYAAAISIFSVMDEPEEKNAGKKVLNKIKGEIHFNNVTFSYPGERNPAINKISFSTKPGEKIALVGKSGGGKTTLINLIPRLYEITQGEIQIDSININDCKLPSLREKIALVSQDTILFNDTVFNNIAYGAKGKSSIEAVKKAAKAANAIEFIEKLPHGFNHVIGDRGVKLSGGQKQRIAIARAILKNAPILLLDEATSALDSESELLVQDALDNLMKKRTSIVIAHRLSTIMNADKILVIHDGELAEQGNHNELMKKKGKYTALYKRGFS
ncbi:MAG: lipid A export permease/ATP-binding protein MsbA [Betaproteobacteria bacterium]|jgi:subfamily B ATP-binding cassette protein MsbA|nr:lipid A export permease/ATP-binding protein MsbA [Nitrosomonadales bacterium]MCH9782229.1 lipid A export permease/ATP-binding protein MsbA [Betaproteobacteria bacterium]MDA7751098.1 lipid A export permease/ATP-binding protein MsbA [Methylophilaceae bacterium]MCH9842100.1 lipid A export permease/ATP-binding protein MsbA [Betaproteobacteria bacterium]MDA9819105.1 lipid A export permease/ATP-binding protein MsbA [Methylophilaceae bacterium]